MPMNPTDEEVNESATQSKEEIEQLLEPQAIPDERIVRHAEKNDSYRESPDLEEEIIQPPLEKVEEVIINEALPIKEVVPEVETPPLEEASETAPVALEEGSPLPLMSQHDIVPEGGPYEEPSVEQSAPEPEVVPLVGNEEPPVQMTVDTGTLPESISETIPTLEAQSTVYHTVSGGPETLNDVASHTKKVEQSATQPNQEGSQTPNYTNAASGYTIPDPKYVSATVPATNSQSSFGVILFLGFILIIGIIVGGTYFLFPDTFKQILSAVLVIKTQLLKQ
jgi:hypothetical protein